MARACCESARSMAGTQRRSGAPLRVGAARTRLSANPAGRDPARSRCCSCKWPRLLALSSWALALNEFICRPRSRRPAPHVIGIADLPHFPHRWCDAGMLVVRAADPRCDQGLVLTWCHYRKLAPNVLMMNSSAERKRSNFPDALNGSSRAR